MIRSALAWLMVARTPAASMNSTSGNLHVGPGTPSPGEWTAIVSRQNSYMVWWTSMRACAEDSSTAPTLPRAARPRRPPVELEDELDQNSAHLMEVIP